MLLKHRVVIAVTAAAFLALSSAVAIAGLNGKGPKKPPAGPLAGWELVRSDEGTVEPNSSAELIANCPAGKVPLGGGFSKAPSTPDSPGGVEVASSFPAFFEFAGQRTSGWIVHVVNRSTADAFVSVWVTCALPRP